MPKKRKSTAITVSSAEAAVSPLPDPSSDAATADTSTLTTIELQEENKRQRAAIASIAGHFLCSIGNNLPLDPVVAEDGRTYNRAAILAHFDRFKKSSKSSPTLLSPVTHQAIGPTLTPAPESFRTTIRALVESGALDDQDEYGADRWAEVDEMFRRATDVTSPDPDAMVLLGNEYLDGSDGFVQDKVRGYEWYCRAARAGSARGLGHQGFCLFYGEGVTASPMEGSIMMASAAERGSELAAYYLGFEFFHGDPLPKNRAMAEYWLTKLVNAGYQDQIQEADFEEAKDMLKTIEKEEQAMEE